MSRLHDLVRWRGKRLGRNGEIPVGGVGAAGGRFDLPGGDAGGDSTFPVGTLVVNIAGSFLLGFILRYTMDFAGMSTETRVFLTIGFCGGFTTFSTFSYEAIALLQEGQWSRAGVYIMSSVTVSLAATLAGLAVAQQILIHARQG